MSYHTGMEPPSYGQPQMTGHPQGYANQGYGQAASFASNNVVVTQSPGCMTSPHMHAPDYLVLSVVAVFFFWPLAICAIMYSVNSRSASACGDYTRAVHDGQVARNLGVTAIVLGIILVVIIVVVQVTILSASYCIGINC